MKFTIKTLGCKVNAYESSVMHDLLINEGYEEVKDGEQANIAIVNTCTVTNTSDSKSLKIIRHTIKENPGCILIATGCFSQINPERLKDMEGVSIVLGNHDKSKIVHYINEYMDKENQITNIYKIEDVPFENMRLNNFDQTRAFVKIEDGCENFCVITSYSIHYTKLYDK